MEHGWGAFKLRGQETLLTPAAVADVLQQHRLPGVIQTDEQRDLQLLHQAARAAHFGNPKTIADQPLAQLAGLLTQNTDDEKLVDWLYFAQPLSPPSVTL